MLVNSRGSLYFDVVEVRFVHVKMIRRLSSINVKELKVDIEVLNTLTKSQERISYEEEIATHDIIGSFWCEFDVLMVVPASKYIRVIFHRPNSILVKERA